MDSELHTELDPAKEVGTVPATEPIPLAWIDGVGVIWLPSTIPNHVHRAGRPASTGFPFEYVDSLTGPLQPLYESPIPVPASKLGGSIRAGERWTSAEQVADHPVDALSTIRQLTNLLKGHHHLVDAPDERPTSNGHTWPCPLFYVNESRTAACTCKPAEADATDLEEDAALDAMFPGADWGELGEHAETYWRAMARAAATAAVGVRMRPEAGR